MTGTRCAMLRMTINVSEKLDLELCRLIGWLLSALIRTPLCKEPLPHEEDAKKAQCPKAAGISHDNTTHEPTWHRKSGASGPSYKLQIRRNESREDSAATHATSSHPTQASRNVRAKSTQSRVQLSTNTYSLHKSHLFLHKPHFSEKALMRLLTLFESCRLPRFCPNMHHASNFLLPVLPLAIKPLGRNGD